MRGKLFSSHSTTAYLHLGLPKSVAFFINAVTTPDIMFAPPLLIKHGLLFAISPFSIIAQVVVFPFVPVTQIQYTSLERANKMLGLSRRAILPGRVVAPLCKRLRARIKSFAIHRIINILYYIEISRKYDIILLEMIIC